VHLVSSDTHVQIIYTVSEKKRSHFKFQDNFAICLNIFPIFEAPCSGVISAWYNLLRTHHLCEAFTWHDVTHDVSQADAQCTLTLDFIPPDVWPWTHRTLILLTILSRVSCKRQYTRHTVTHSKYRWVETLAGSVWAELDHRHVTAAIGQWRCHLGACDTCVKAQGDILNNICIEFTCSSSVCLLNSRPEYLT